MLLAVGAALQGFRPLAVQVAGLDLVDLASAIPPEIEVAPRPEDLRVLLEGHIPKSLARRAEAGLAELLAAVGAVWLSI